MRELSSAARKQGELWDRGARDWANLMESFAVPLWTAVLDAARVTAGTRMLDAGCGSGGACVLAAGRGAGVFGLDASANLLTIARERLPQSDFRLGELDDLPYSNGEFDAVIAVNSLQFAADSQVAMHELGRVCREHGRVVAAAFSTPELCDTAQISRAIVQLFDQPPSGGGPFALSAPSALEGLVNSVAGLSLDSIAEVQTAQEFPDLETAVRAQMSTGASWRAVEILGQERVTGAVRTVLDRFRQPGGVIRLLNRFRVATARKQNR